MRDNRPFFIFTLNPLIHTKNSLAQLVRLAADAGITIIGRLNMSFFKPDLKERYSQFVSWFYELKESTGLEAAQFEIDTCGQKLRFPKNIPPILFQEDQELVLSCCPRESVSERDDGLPTMGVEYPWFVQHIAKDELIVLGDGEVRLRVKEIIAPDAAVVKVERVSREEGVPLRSKMGITIKDEDLPLPTISELDEAAMRFGAEYPNEIQFLGISMVRKPSDLVEYQEWIARNCPAWPVITVPKLETLSSWEHMDEILKESQAVMLALGDGFSKLIVLGKEHKLPELQERFVQAARQYKVMCILATGLMTWPISQAGLTALRHAAHCLQPDGLLFPETADLTGSALLEFVATVINVVQS